MISEKYEMLKKTLGKMEQIIVAFSGGVDSTLLLKACIDAIGTSNILAVTANSETYPVSELEEAIKLAAYLGVNHRIVETSELNIPGYIENTSNRCYFCKKNLFEILVPIMEQYQYKNVVYGLIADDMNEHRPGTKAAKELGVRGPLQEVGLTKEEIRILSRDMGLPTWDKPSFACLSSRIMYGEEITMEKLRKIDRSEQYLRGLGIRQVRVRTHDDIARIEVEPDCMLTVLKNHLEITSTLQSFGYRYVSMDLYGYQSGSMNKGII